MQNLKINSTYTPYWCVVVPVEAEDIVLRDYDKYTVICHSMNTTAGIGKTPTSLIRVNKNAELLGCITSSGMDEGVREIDTMLAEHWAGICSHWKVNIMKLLTHNQITLTADQKAVVVKQKL